MIYIHYTKRDPDSPEKTFHCYQKQPYNEADKDS